MTVGTGTQISAIAISTLEELGFVATSTTRQVLSSSGITGWYPTEGAGQSLTGRSFYSSVDKGIFQPTLSSGTTPDQLYFTDDGKTGKLIPISAQNTSVTFSGITYDSTNDKYFVVGSSSQASFVTSLPRSYNKATQFVLPEYFQTQVKVTATP